MLNSVGIFNQKDYMEEAKRIVNSPASVAIPRFIRRSDGAVVRYDTTKNLFLVADSEGKVISMFPPASGAKIFTDELGK